ncbi:Vps54-domain-containing protein [Phlegmacium glaucopus]|nr:Vps54-domain-containing protein [Phlegmacium glaucopus]
MSDVSSVASRPQSPVPVPQSRPYRFTWDPASRRPGPESVSGTTEGRGADDFGGPHPTLGLFNSSSLALASLPTEWSSSRTGFHAISTVLNNPHKRQAPPKAHSSLPGVPAADLPRVRRKDFESYLNAIAPEWERYEHNLQLGQEGQAQLSANLSTPRNSIGGGDPPTTPRQSIQLDSHGKYIPPLDSVPAIFFEKSFNLGDPRIFATVTEQDAAAALLTPQDDSFADPFSLSHSLPLLEKFSHYADTVEQHLVREISIRSSSFFAALTNLHDLQTESEHCLDRISKLRIQLQEVDKNSARGGLEMVRKECKMANLSRVRDGVKMIGGVVEMTGVAKGLVSAGQWGEALDIIEEIDKLWQVEEPVPESAAVERPRGSFGLHNGNGNAHGSQNSLPPTPEEEPSEALQTEETRSTKRLAHQHPIALSSLHSFSALPSHLRVLTMEIAASLSSELVSVLRSDLEVRINNVGKADVDADQGLKDRLKPLLLNLVRTKGLKEGMLSWREVVLIEVRGVVKKILPAFEPDEDENGKHSLNIMSRAGLANHLRNLQHLDFVLLIQKIYRGLLNGVEGLHAQGNIIVEVLEALKGHLRQKITDIPALQEDLADIVSSSAELSNTQAAKVISYRAEQHAALELADFLVFFNDSWAFVVKCEVLSRRMIVGLRGTVVGQAKLFLQSFHQIRISRSAKLVEDERWDPTEVTPGLQHITNLLVDSAVRDPPDLIIKTDDTIFSPVTTTFSSPTPTTSNGKSAIVQSFSNALSKLSSSNGNTAPTISSTTTKHLHIEDRTYYAVSATAEVLTLLMDYLRVVVNLSMLTTDAMSRVIEFLKSFNSRTCQVVLGAGAMRSAGLKNITAKHLALASQSLSIVFELIPYVRETFRRHLSQKQAVMLVEFDKLKRDYQEHQNEIHSKLVAIMGDRLSSHIKALKAVDWTVPKPGGGVNEYMEILVKETATLHKVLSRYLAPSVVEYVMSQVFAAINHRLSEEYGAIDLPDQEAKARLLGDAKYLQQKFSALKNVGTSNGMLETVVAEKSLHRANSTAGPSTPTRSNTLSTNQRLKGLLSGKSSSFDKTIPIPASTTLPPPVPPSADKPRSTALTTDYHQNMDRDRLTNESQISLGMSPSPPIQKPTALPDHGQGAGAGFKQVELPSSNSHLGAPHLRELKDMGASSSIGSEGPPPLPSTILDGGPMKPKDK